jgi:hypothetical protein
MKIETTTATRPPRPANNNTRSLEAYWGEAMNRASERLLQEHRARQARITALVEVSNEEN